jgi:hypothetical protein
MAVKIRGQIDSVYVLTVEDDAISALRIVRNPDKLRYISRQLAM